MSLSRFDTFARSVVGPSAAGAQVFLCLQPAVTNSLPPSPLAQLYSDPLGANPISQPLICDGFGHASCYVSSGTFTEVVVYGGMLVQVYPDQFIASTIAVQVNGLEVNGNPVTGPNFNSTVPATPVGSTTVIWQFDGLGNVTGSIPTSIYAPIASPAFTGTPTAPTPASSDDSNTIATTAYVQSVLAGSGLVVSVFGRTGAVEATSGDYTVAQITGAAPLASPALTGTPTAPTPATADSSTLLATTAFVKAQEYGVGSVTTFSAANIGGIATASVTNPTSTPALTFTLEAQAANTVWAGPTSGSSAPPTFRSLVAADITGVIGGSIASTQVAVGSGSNTIAGSYSFIWDGTTLTLNGVLNVFPPNDTAFPVQIAVTSANQDTKVLSIEGTYDGTVTDSGAAFYAADIRATSQGPSGTIGNMAAVHAQANANSAPGCTITNLIGILSEVNTGGGGAQVNSYGLLVQFLGTIDPTTSYGVRVLPSTGSEPVTWAFYADDAPSYFGASIVLNSTITDGSSSVGASGKMLSSTGTATAWATPASLTAAPATASSSGTAGEIAYDATHFYVCISTNSWVRATFAAW